ncbi:MAG: thiamine pyrophosphate-dependent enzyme, partial [Nitrospirota bacterium]|nr:thiamine pyrophosphate-dependent enzyme [Nitrospirota bacterium]
KAELYRFCESDAMLGGHPQYGKIPGVEASTGSLGHGFSIGIGIALNGKIDRKNYRTFVLLGDGECNEGSVWEAAMCASKHKLNRLTVLVDYNKMQCFGNTCDVQDLEPFADKWRSFGFEVREADGHDVKALRNILLDTKLDESKPDVIICHTVKGKGVASIERNAAWHHKSKISDDEMEKLFEELESSR